MLSAKSIPCSVLILTRNSSSSLRQCLKNLAPFQDILVRDGNSEDDTVAIAKEYGARVLPQYETTEKSVRIKDFTEMQLWQRRDALCDWVLYLDSDEYMSDELVEEVGEILKTAVPKTIIKFPRVPVVDGIPRTKGIAFPEVMPRIHNRASGATLKAGKTVHEKYQYDSSFQEIAARSPLYVPLEPVGELRSKDDRYIALEVERMRTTNYTWPKYVRWFLLREPLLIAAYFLKVLVTIPSSFSRESLPFSQNFRFVTYHWRLLSAVTGMMLKKGWG